MSLDKATKNAVLANLIAAGIIIVAALNLFTIPLFEPLDRSVTTDVRPSFSWGGFQKSYEIMIDDNPEFTSPVAENVSVNSYIPDENMEFGTYYWKVASLESGISSPVRSFTIDSEVALERSGKALTNAGNVGIKLVRLTGSVSMKVNESMEIGGNEDVRASQE